MAKSADALERFERQTAWPMLVLSLAIIPLLVIPLVADLSPGTKSALFALDWILWAMFAVEYGIRLCLAPEKGRFVRSNLIDLVVVIVPFSVRSAWPVRLGCSDSSGPFGSARSC